MKNRFSNKWKASERPGKQRKYRENAPLHLKKKFLNANLSRELRKKYQRRSMSLRKNDTVKVMKGKFKKKTGKIISVNTKKMKVEIEGIQIKKQDGSKANVKFNPSVLQITELNLEDRKRNEILKSNKSETAETKENAS